MKTINAIIAFVKSKQAAREERLYREAAVDAYVMMLSHDPNKAKQHRS